MSLFSYLVLKKDYIYVTMIVTMNMYTYFRNVGGNSCEEI